MLRNEWGFKGAVITDYYNAGVVHDADECIRAGNDLMLDPNGRPSYFGDQMVSKLSEALCSTENGSGLGLAQTLYNQMKRNYGIEE